MSTSWTTSHLTASHILSTSTTHIWHASMLVSTASFRLIFMLFAKSFFLSILFGTKKIRIICLERHRSPISYKKISKTSGRLFKAMKLVLCSSEQNQAGPCTKTSSRVKALAFYLRQKNKPKSSS